MCGVRSREKRAGTKKKKSTMVSKKKWTVMNPIRRPMKKCNPSSGQNGQLVHWWVLIHSGPVTHSPDRTRPGTPFLTSAIPGLRFALECRNLISSNSFAHRLGTGNSALRLAPGPVGLKPELRHGLSEFIYKMHPNLEFSLNGSKPRSVPPLDLSRQFL
jgi:hypothetical protein